MEHSHILNCINMMVRKYPQHFTPYKVTEECKDDIKVAQKHLNNILCLANQINSRSSSNRYERDWDDWFDIDWRDYISNN